MSAVAASMNMRTLYAPLRNRAGLPQSAAPEPGGLLLPDWDTLFNAVTERLQRLARDTEAAAAGTKLPALPPETHRPLGECLAALQQLHHQLEPALGDDRQLRAELSTALDLLARTRAELAHARIGQQRAQHQALHDALTLLPNRSYFHERMERTLAGAGDPTLSLAVLYVDLDGFKQINDTHGHATGDATLCIVATRLAHALRAQDTVCRLGGDEFACLVEAPIDRERMSAVAAKLFDVVSAPLQVGALRLSVQPSIGIAMYPQDGTTGAILLHRADAAMFRAKRRQLGYAFFDRRSDL